MSENFTPHTNGNFSTLLESEAGVMEVFLTTVPANSGVRYRAIGSVAQSGRLKPTDSPQVTEAVRLMHWAKENQCVFEGRVSPQTESAN